MYIYHRLAHTKYAAYVLYAAYELNSSLLNSWDILLSVLIKLSKIQDILLQF